jgi:hypothetical protein
MDTAVLEEVVHWVKTLTAVGVSPDAAAKVTTKILLAANADDNETDDFWSESDEDLDDMDDDE